MQRSSSETTTTTTTPTSPIPISPFSFTHSVPSEPTSDEQPDLGAFTTVLRAWTNLQPPPRILPQVQPSTATTTTTTTTTATTSIQQHSTVWNQDPIASYLHTPTPSNTTADDSPPPSPSPSPIEDSTNNDNVDDDNSTEGARTVEIHDISLSDFENHQLDEELQGYDDLAEHPSLGLLDEALSFIAAERARWTAQREAGVAGTSMQWRHVVEPRRKRRRKRPKPVTANPNDTTSKSSGTPSHPLLSSTSPSDSSGSESESEHAYNLAHSSSTHHRGAGAYKSTPATPYRLSTAPAVLGSSSSSSLSPTTTRALKRKGKGKPTTLSILTHSRSTPQLRLSTASLISATATSSNAKKLKRPRPPTGTITSSPTKPPNPPHTSPIKPTTNSKLKSKSTFADAEDADPYAHSRRARLSALAKKLRRIFPEDWEDLGLVLRNLGGTAAAVAEDDIANNVRKPRKLKKKLGTKRAQVSPAKEDHGRRGEGFGFGFDSGGVEDEKHKATVDRSSEEGDEWEEERDEGGEDEDVEMGVKGRPTREGDTLIHVFIDHSNILIGLLNHLRRHPLPRPLINDSSPTNPRPNSYTSSSTSRRLSITDPEASKDKKDNGHDHDHDHDDHDDDDDDGNDSRSDAILLANGKNNNNNKMKKKSPVAASTLTGTPNASANMKLGIIPVPAFTLASTGNGHGYDTPGNKAGNGSGHGSGDPTPKEPAPTAAAVQKTGKYGGAKHLWHAALALILERGRPITRRVLVTSSPLYQPMDGMERLGYEVRVYIRVPDLGDGMDRQRDFNSKRSQGTPGHTRASSGGGNGSGIVGKKTLHVRRASGGNSAGASASASPSVSGTSAESSGEVVLRGAGAGARKTPAVFVRPQAAPIAIPGGSRGPGGFMSQSLNTVATAGLSSGLPFNAPTAHTHTHLHPQSHVHTPFASHSNLQNNVPQSQGAQSQSQSQSQSQPNAGQRPARVRYREQGVDELLQLKLHQVLAATDVVPEGATIVLATGDGNVGQFNEDGFLGPVRIALRRGWKVELYAWEDGLSRAWRREFGETSEWGRRGMFRIIAMEQFVDGLVEWLH